MNYNEMLSLLKYIESSNFQDFEIDFEETYINLSKNKNNSNKKMKSTSVEEIENKPVVNISDIKIEPVEEVTRPMTILPKDEDLVSGCTVNSPIVGTFYESSSPDKPPYVKVGDEIKEGDVLCIIEAMKVMNEVKSKVNGKISRILVENENVVEYNQPLFLIDECK